ncbi:MAG: DUF3187 family protein [Deltaproteobacteria bacterium]|nr:DUF3187 family protein [Deltaproteobacteria bacterium]
MILCIVLVALFSGKTSLATDAWEAWQQKAGPISVVDQNPVQLLFLQPMPDRATPLPEGHSMIRINTTLTNTLVSKASDHYEATLDMEAVRIRLEASYGLLPGLELACSVPVSHYYSGLLDKAVYDVEDFFGNIRGIRESETRNRFTYAVKKDGTTFISGSENTVGLGDVVMRVKAAVLKGRDGGPALSARACLKLPTGRASKAFGSGKTDWGVGLLLEQDIQKATVYVNGDVTFPGEAFEDEGVFLQEFFTILFGAEYRFTPRFSVIAQLYHTGRPFQDTGVEVLDRRIYELVLGASYRIQQSLVIQGGLVEDIIDSADATADVTFFLDLGILF